MKWLRQLFCRHRYSLSELERREDGMVTCQCKKCRKVAVADYGLLITTDWEP